MTGSIRPRLAKRQALSPRLSVSALVGVAIALLTLFLWLDWMPHLNALRDAGDQARFARGHRLSVWVNGVELVAAFVVLVGLV